jgi:Tol biopolymer transport system component
MTDRCSGFDLLLMVYADGEAAPDERYAVEAHIADCLHCRQRLSEWQALSREADSLVKEVSGDNAPAHPAAPRRDAADQPSTLAARSSARHPRSAHSDDPADPAVAHRGTRRTDRANVRTLAIGVVMSLAAIVLIPLAVARQESGPVAGVASHVRSTSASAMPRQASATRSSAPSYAAVPTKPTAVTSVASMFSSTASLQSAAKDGVTLAGAIAAVRDGNIFVHSAAGDSEIVHDGQATAPRWSPSGRWLLYETTGPDADAGLMLAQPGSVAAPWPLPAPAHRGLARWSPSHDEIAVAARGGSLWLVQAGSDTPRQLLPPGGAVTNLAWSPDGSQLAVERRGVGNSVQSIWLVSRGGAIAQAPIPSAVAAVPASKGSQTGDVAGRTAVDNVPVLGSWSPSNSGFTYWSDNASTPGASSPAALALWSPRQGTRPLLPDVLMYRDFVSWAPDGHALAAVASVLTTDGSERLGQITVVPIAPPGAARTLADPGRADGDAAWSPDGGLIAYASSAVASPERRADTARRIWVEAPDGSGRRPLSPGPADSFPQWSKDGKEIIYVHQTAGGAQLWLVGRDGSDPHPVVAAIAGMQQLPRQDFGDSGLASYRGVFDWSAASGRG